MSRLAVTRLTMRNERPWGLLSSRSSAHPISLEANQRKDPRARDHWIQSMVQRHCTSTKRRLRKQIQVLVKIRTVRDRIVLQDGEDT